MKQTKAQIANIEYQNAVRQVVSDKFHEDIRYRVILMNIIDNISAMATIMDEYVMDFDSLTQKAYLSSKFRKSARVIVHACNDIMNEFIKTNPDNVLKHTEQQMIDMKTYARHMKQMVDYTKELDEEGLIKALSSIKLLAKIKINS